MTVGLLAARPPQAPVGLLRHADFLRLWTGQTVSRFREVGARKRFRQSP